MAARREGFPKGYDFRRKTLADGRKVTYGYLGRGPGRVSLGIEGTPEFHAKLAEALSKAPPDGKLSRLIYEYKASKAFARLEPRTRADYLRQLDRIQEHFGSLSLAAMASPRMAEHIERWRDSMDASPRQADYAVTVLKLLLAWGVGKGRLAHNRAARLEKIYVVDRSERIWSAEQEAAFAASAPAPLVLAEILAAETGISQGDLLKLPKSADQGEIIGGRRGKTKVPFSVPVSPRLRAALDAAPAADAITILARSDGRPWDLKGNGFRAAWSEACKDAGITGVTFNDLRGTFITRRRAMGWTAEETALCSGHPIAGEKGAQSAYAGRAIIAEANARRLFAAWYGPKREQELQTGLQTAQGAQELRS